MGKKPPTRTCIACGTAADKRALCRIVRSPEGHVALDASGKAPGRGAYLCLDEACFAKAQAKRLLDARLRVRVGAEDYKRLEQEFRDLIAGAREMQ